MTTQTFQNLLLAGFVSFTATAFPAQPFGLPWDDASPGVTDFAIFNRPITSNSRITVDKNGHFVAEDKRVRFLGVNCAGDSPFMPTNKADGAASRMAKFGINNVRLHHMDSSWATGGGIIQYTPETSTNINPAQLEKLHFLVSRLKAHGIYSDVNLLVGRTFRAGDGLGPEVAKMDWKDGHILAFFNEAALGLQKDYATQLLTPVNPFTGLSLAKDPAVSFVEILNENGIIQNWLDGGLDRLPQVYELQLQNRWNIWLQKRYATQSALLTGWQVIQTPLGDNILKNGSFKNGMDSWNPETHEDARAEFTPGNEFKDGASSVKISVLQPGLQSWHVQLNQGRFSVENGVPYTISFWAKSPDSVALDATVMRAGGDWEQLGFGRKFHLTPEWQQFSATFIANNSATNARVNFGGMGHSKVTVLLAQVSLQKGGNLGVPTNSNALQQHAIPIISRSGNGFAGTKAAQRDWLNFLRDLENAYYDAMVGHLRTNVGYPGLIFGTIMANSPATVQNRMDVIDAHAYWQHPQFPGKPWDSTNWFVPNVTLVNSDEAHNTISGLALQRIQGKPFTVTEYQHPAPNSYGGEAPLLLASYAAFQDWDGLWLFDYGPGYNESGRNFVTGFFSIMNHPVKMANLLLAANLFRREDVAVAREEVHTSLNADRELDLLAGPTASWSVFTARHCGIQPEMAFSHRVETRLSTTSSANSIPPQATFGLSHISDTKELNWDRTKTNQGLVTINTPKTKAFVGFADDREVSLGEITFRPQTTRLNWCSIGATLRSGESFTNKCSALIVAGGWCENSGQVWTSAKKESVGNHWGHEPVLIEIVPFTMTLPVNREKVRVWSLDDRGQRKSPISLEGNTQQTVLKVTPENGSLWYELEVSGS